MSQSYRKTVPVFGPANALQNQADTIWGELNASIDRAHAFRKKLKLRKIQEAFDRVAAAKAEWDEQKRQERIEADMENLRRLLVERRAKLKQREFVGITTKSGPLSAGDKWGNL